MTRPMISIQTVVHLAGECIIMSIVCRLSFAEAMIVMRFFVASVLLLFQSTQGIAQQTLTAQIADSAKVELGSKTAKGGFRNEDEIRDKFNQWTTDTEARAWLVAMRHDLAEIEKVTASKPHG